MLKRLEEFLGIHGHPARVDRTSGSLHLAGRGDSRSPLRLVMDQGGDRQGARGIATLDDVFIHSAAAPAEIGATYRETSELRRTAKRLG